MIKRKINIAKHFNKFMNLFCNTFMGVVKVAHVNLFKLTNTPTNLIPCFENYSHQQCMLIMFKCVLDIIWMGRRSNLE